MNNGITLGPTVYLERVYPKELHGQKLKPLYPSQYDVVAKDMFGDIKGTWPWYYKSKPDKRYKSVVLNCARYAIIWTN